MDHRTSSGNRDLYAPQYVGPGQLPAALYDEVLPGLYQGGTPDGDWRRSPGGPAAAPVDADLEFRFDAVVTLFAWAMPCDWGVEELRYGFYDADTDLAEMDKVVRAARWAHERWSAGDTVLIRCQAGLNRSGLVTALVLMLAGRSADEAIRLVRRKRSQVALFNDGFVDWLLQDAPAALGQREARPPGTADSTAA